MFWKAKSGGIEISKSVKVAEHPLASVAVTE